MGLWLASQADPLYLPQPGGIHACLDADGGLTMIDEDPSPEDLERFSGDTALCPDCGAQVWDQAEVCSSCGAYLHGETVSQPPVQRWFRRRWLTLVAVVTAIAFGLLAMRLLR